MRITETERRAKELSYAVKAIGGQSLPKSAPRAVTFISKIESAPAKEGTPGKDAIVDHEEIYNKILERLKKEKSLVVSDLKDGQAFVFNNTKYGTHELMHGGSAQSATSFTTNEIVAGSGTSWTLAATPVSGSVQLYGNGQYLTPGGVDYTIAGTAITTINSFVAGTIVANYRT